MQLLQWPACQRLERDLQAEFRQRYISFFRLAIGFLLRTCNILQICRRSPWKFPYWYHLLGSAPSRGCSL